MGIFSKETDYFGIDIGSGAIRVVQMRAGGGKPVLVTYGDVQVPGGLTTSDASADRIKMAEIIKQLVRDARISSKNVVAGLPSSTVFASVITTPKLTNAELDKAIRYQADQYIPMDINQVKMDWSVIGRSQDDKELEVLLVAAPVTSTQKYLEIMEQAGLDILALEANATAVARSLVAPSTPLAVIVLDFAQTSTDISIVYNNAPRLIRSIAVGSLTFVRAVEQSLGLDTAQAEQFTLRFGLTQTKLEGQVLKAIKPSLDSLLAEVDKSTKFFLNRYQGVKMEKVIVTGSAAGLPELPAYLSTATGLPVEIGNAWVNVAYPASLQDQLMQISSQYAVASGLAQRNFL
jgi:type IV pilus assembly protein PilM